MSFQCINDDFVLFANTYLGYACSPQNVQSFMSSYDCVNKVTRQKVGSFANLASIPRLAARRLRPSHTRHYTARTEFRPALYRHDAISRMHRTRRRSLVPTKRPNATGERRRTDRLRELNTRRERRPSTGCGKIVISASYVNTM